MYDGTFWENRYNLAVTKLHERFCHAWNKVTCSKLTIETLEQGVKHVQS